MNIENLFLLLLFIACFSGALLCGMVIYSAVGRVRGRRRRRAAIDRHIHYIRRMK